MLNHAKSLGISTEKPRFPIVRSERWVHPDFAHGIAADSPVPLKGAAAIRVRLLEGKTVDSATEGLFVRCKVAAKGTSDWHLDI